MSSRRTPPSEPVDQDGRKQDDAGNHTLPVHGDARDDEPVLQDSDEHDAEERPQHASDPTDEARASEKDGGRRGELDSLIGIGRCGGQAGGLDHAREGAQARGDRVSGEPHEADVDSGEPRSFRIPSDSSLVICCDVLRSWSSI